MQQKRIGAKIANEILMSIRAERKQRGEVPLTDPIGVDRDGNEITLADVLSSDETYARKRRGMKSTPCFGMQSMRHLPLGKRR